MEIMETTKASILNQLQLIQDAREMINMATNGHTEMYETYIRDVCALTEAYAKLLDEIQRFTRL